MYDFFTKTRLGLHLTYGAVYFIAYKLVGLEMMVVIGISGILANQNFKEK